ncbi:MAG: 50S ribosome-binding GTPase, partial [Candidatus Omnitrophica bacterium]|nr:50S ribosome-binding GTPase [Candidatus Omnitrophota bacterium]
MKIDKILLMGNPNVGKSAIFSRLVGARVVISNYPGTTVGFTQGQMKVGQERPMIIDVPGTYSLEPTSKAEEVATEMLKGGDLIINVVDATNLERNLYLTLELLEKDIPVVIALNIWDETKHKGIEIDVEKLEKALGVPVIPTCGLTGEGIKELVDRLREAKVLKKNFFTDKKRWEKIGKIVEDVQKLTHHHHTVLQMLEEWSIKPATGLPIAMGVIYCSFLTIRFIGEGLIGYLFEPLFEKLWLPLMMKLSAILGQSGFFHQVLIGNLIK